MVTELLQVLLKLEALMDKIHLHFLLPQLVEEVALVVMIDPLVPQEMAHQEVAHQEVVLFQMADQVVVAMAEE